MQKFFWCLVAVWSLPMSALAVPDFVKDHFSDGSEDPNAGYFVGEVESAEQAGQYVYLKVKSDKGNSVQWVATQKFEARAGMKVRYRPGQSYKNFKSPTTGKIYPEIYLVQTIDVAKTGTAVSECSLIKSWKDGEMVSLRGVVTKVNVGILGKNWVHIQDEQGRCLELDLTITTNNEPKVGDLVTAVGTLRLDHSVGDGAYVFPVLVEDAKVDKN